MTVFNLEDLGDGAGKITALIDGEIAGRISWHFNKREGRRVYDDLFVAPAHRGRRLAGMLQAKAKEQRELAGVDEWRAVPMTEDGRRAVAGHIDREYCGVDPRQGDDHG